MAAQSDSLYERLGGEPALAAAVDILYARVQADPLLAPFFENQDVDRIKAHQRAFLIHALGGPREFHGSLRESHASLCIEKRHFYAVADHMLVALSQLGVDDEINAEVISVIETLWKEIVNSPDQREK